MRIAGAHRLGRSLALIGWRFPAIRLVTSPYPTVLLYHSVVRRNDGNSIDRDSFESHVALLKQNFDFISACDVGHRRRRRDRQQVLLTFDDGMRNNFEVVRPILLRHRVPAVFFISSRHATRGQYLWFVYLRSLTKYFPHESLPFQGGQIDMRRGARSASVKRLTEFLLSLEPHPGAMYRAIQEELPPLEDFMTPEQLADECDGMTQEQAGELAQSSLFSIGCHTVDHPFLSRCEPEEIYRQIDENKRWLDGVSGNRSDTIAYPFGDYDAQVLDKCRELLLTQGFAVSRTMGSAPGLEIPRIGIYSPPLEFLGFKVQWGNYLRAARIAMG